MRNRCFQIHIAEKQLVGLAFIGMQSYLKEKLKGIQFFKVAQKTPAWTPPCQYPHIYISTRFLPTYAYPSPPYTPN
jgi:hypothetical protein